MERGCEATKVPELIPHSEFRIKIMTIQEAKIHGKRELVSSPTPELDTAVLLQHITGFDKTHLLLNRDFCLTAEQEAEFLSAIERRKTGFPVAYITGHKEFFGLDFYVTPDVLIPKPDTELLVELALDALEDKFRAKPEAIPTVCDMCTGSGCVGISINSKLRIRNSEIKLTLVDISEKALGVARKNAERILGTSEAMSQKKPDERSNVLSQEGRAKQCPESNSEFRIPNYALFLTTDSVQLFTSSIWLRRLSTSAFSAAATASI